MLMTIFMTWRRELFFNKEIKSAAAAKSLQSCPTLCDPIDGSPPGSPIPGILQARTLEWVAIAFSSHLSKELLFTEALPRWCVCEYVCACSVNLTL